MYHKGNHLFSNLNKAKEEEEKKTFKLAINKHVSSYPFDEIHTISETCLEEDFLRSIFIFYWYIKLLCIFR